MVALKLLSAESNQTSAKTDGNWQPSEVQLLLLCARSAIDLRTADAIESLCDADLDRNRVLELVAASDVSCLL